MVARPFFPLLLALSFGFGCGREPSTPVAINADQLRNAIVAETGDANTHLLVDHGNLQIQSGGQRITVHQGETRQKPESLPSDIVLPNDAHYDLWTEAPRGSTLSLLTNLQPDALAEFLLHEWPSHAWQHISDVQADTLRHLTFRKANRQVSITIESESESDPSTRALLFLETLPETDSP